MAFHDDEYRWLTGDPYPFTKRDARHVKAVLDACGRDLALAKRVVECATRDAWVREANGLRWGAVVTKLAALLSRARAATEGEGEALRTAREVFRTCDGERYARLPQALREAVRSMLRDQFRGSDEQVRSKAADERVLRSLSWCARLLLADDGGRFLDAPGFCTHGTFESIGRSKL